MKIKSSELKTKSHLANWVWLNKANASGPHKNKKREANRKACRGKYKGD